MQPGFHLLELRHRHGVRTCRPDSSYLCEDGRLALWLDRRSRHGNHADHHNAGDPITHGDYGRVILVKPGYTRICNDREQQPDQSETRDLFRQPCAAGPPGHRYGNRVQDNHRGRAARARRTKCREGDPETRFNFGNSCVGCGTTHECSNEGWQNSAGKDDRAGPDWHAKKDAPGSRQRRKSQPYRARTRHFRRSFRSRLLEGRSCIAHPNRV